MLSNPASFLLENIETGPGMTSTCSKVTCSLHVITIFLSNPLLVKSVDILGLPYKSEILACSHSFTVNTTEIVNSSPLIFKIFFHYHSVEQSG